MMGRVLWGRPDVRTPLDVHELPVPVPGLPAGLEGLRLAAMTDLHFGRFVHDSFASRVVEAVNATQPDLVVLVGDMVNHTPGQIGPCAAMLAGLRAPLGVFASPGNHDYYAGIYRYEKALREVGIPLLINAHRVLAVNGARLVLAGLDDDNAGRPDLDAALAGAPTDVPVVLMCHNPDGIANLLPGRPVALTIAGHTHGGQVTFWGRPVMTRIRNRRYWRGWAAGPRGPVYTSRGVGPVAMPLRIGSDPEVPIFRLVRE